MGLLVNKGGDQRYGLTNEARHTSDDDTTALTENVPAAPWLFVS